MIAEIDPRWQGFYGGIWTDEPSTIALARTPPFGRRFFDTVFQQFPKMAANAYFLRWSTQPDDTYAVFYSSECEVCIQIDPLLEYIIVWNADECAEFGDWGADQVPPAVEYFRKLILGKN